MPITFHMLEAGAKAGLELRQRILAALEAAALKAVARLPSLDVDTVVFEHPEFVIPRIGINGYANNAHTLNITFDPDHPHFLAHLEDECGATLCHELHHCARPHYGRSLGQRFVSEGLAQCFEEECGFRTPFYATECAGEALRGYAGRALPLLDRSDLNFGDWMFGKFEKKDGEFPYQCGYSLGYALVKAWLKHADTTAALAYDVDAKAMLDAWRSGTINPLP